ncbi:chemotaxis protein CheW [Chitinasiproducens palmae]|uniref:Chemotaxis-related protein WspB n=1 Tax=Chitinasiproducens palmae TaxID=1770053 RepID=A0A1H2PJ56_9BURK|nr:chemotaxis protein CheW [Chitinasiproducens palmae]SDV46387.1 chemotaxis-related protein WspB [Chitinasiproducens palmae]
MTMLFLTFRIARDWYGLDVRRIRRVLPLQALKQIPAAPHWLAGLWRDPSDKRHGSVPVIDLVARMTGQPATPRVSTRLLLVDYVRADRPWAPAVPLGLIAEQATETLRVGEDALLPSGIDTPETPFLGPVFASRKHGLVQWVEVDALLGAEVCGRLYPDDGGARELAGSGMGSAVGSAVGSADGAVDRLAAPGRAREA